jgi:redox-sensing transcriptional repressor
MISQRVLKRFLTYRLVLLKLQRIGFTRVFSYTLGKETRIKPEQVRKDFSIARIQGSRRGGYNIAYILESINRLFKQDEERRVILVGLGNIGQALINYIGFKESRIKIVAGFDLDPSKYNRKSSIPVYPVEKIAVVVKEYDIKTAIIAVPEAAGQEVCDRLVNAGIKGILNFSPGVLHVPDHVIINYVNIRNELESLFYFS